MKIGLNLNLNGALGVQRTAAASGVIFSDLGTSAHNYDSFNGLEVKKKVLSMGKGRKCGL